MRDQLRPKRTIRSLCTDERPASGPCRARSGVSAKMTSSFQLWMSLLAFLFHVCIVGSLDSVIPTISLTGCVQNSFGDLTLRQAAIEDSPPPICTEWRDDVAQRYSELKPPTRKRGPLPQPMLKGELMRKLSQEKVKSLLSEATRKESSRTTDSLGIMLDLDKTCLFGNDGNDLGIALQWMERPHETVKELYHLLINPALRPAYSKFASQGKIKVAIYTMRASLLYYRSNFRGMMIPLQYAPEWHVDGQLIIPSGVSSSADVMAAYTGPNLIDDERVDISQSMQRLLAARDAIQHALGLALPPPVVISASSKDVPRTAEALGFPPASTFLWDDNPSLVGRVGVVPISPYVELDRAAHARLADFLEKNLPASSLDDDLLDFMASAHPGESVLAFEGEDGSLPRWNLPLSAEASPQPWPVPEPSCAPALDKALLAMHGWEEGCLSPVTPTDGTTGQCAAESGMADGRRLLSARRPVAYEDL